MVVSVVVVVTGAGTVVCCVVVVVLWDVSGDAQAARETRAMARAARNSFFMGRARLLVEERDIGTATNAAAPWGVALLRRWTDLS